MAEESDTIELGPFSLPWLGSDPKGTRSAGMMSIRYNDPLKIDIMRESIIDILIHYPFFMCNIERRDGRYIFSIPNEVTEEEIEGRIFVVNETLEENFDRLSSKQIDLFNDPLYHIYLLPGNDSFDIVIYGAHVIGDGLTSSTFLAILLNNYHASLQGDIPKLVYPEMEYHQLLEYAYTMRHTRFGPLLVPRWFRFIPGYLYYRKLQKQEVEDQIFNEPAPLDAELFREKFEMPPSFAAKLEKYRDSDDINSNHLITALLSYTLAEVMDYEEVTTSYPINIRNSYGFEAGNLLTVNTVKIKQKTTVIDHLKHVRDLLDQEKKQSSPYYAISLGKFLPKNYEDMRSRMKDVVKKSNLRISNVGSLPPANLDKLLDREYFRSIPVSDYYANALPLNSIGAHFFFTSIARNGVKMYFLTCLYYERTYDAVKKVVNHLLSLLDTDWTN